MVEELEDQLSESRFKKGQLQKVCRKFHGGDGKVFVKLKSVHREEDQEEEDEVCGGENGKKITRICHVCNKGFSSGKALGGHMRIHGQQYKKRKEDAVFEEEGEEEEEEDEDCCDENEEDERVVMVKRQKKMKMEVPACSICGKDFQSMKSLYGHMRSHKRNWKGIHPPPEETAEKPVVSGAAATVVVDLKKALKCWSVTAKRGRKVMSGGGGDQTSSLSEDTEEEQLRDAAHELMMLAHGESQDDDDEELDSNSLSYKVDDEEHEDRNNWANLDFTARKPAAFPVVKQQQQLRIDGGNTKNSRQNTSCVMTKNVRGKSKAMPKNQEPAALAGTENSSGGEESKTKLIPRYKETRANENTKKKNMKLVKLKDLGSVHHNAAAAIDHDNRNPAAAEAEKYKCSKCDKWFPSHQALGGHKSSHNKFKMVIQNSIDNDSNYAAAHQVLLISSTQVTNSPGELSHIGTSDGGGGSSSHQHHQVLDFDLNEVPQTTEEENEAAAAEAVDNHHYGYI